MLKRVYGYFDYREPDESLFESRALEESGFVVLKQVFTKDEIRILKADVERVFESVAADHRGRDTTSERDEMFRYEMFNRSAPCQEAVANPTILGVIEPLLGDDCHIIANTAWRNPPKQPKSHGGEAWHIDAGPHIPLPPGVSWPKEIPHPVFAIGAHIYLQDCHLDDGPTGVIPGSHLSGRFPPADRDFDDDLTYDDEAAVPLIASAGDVGLFVSDVWHRRMPSGDNDAGRFFLQVHYGRRDIAQRVRPTEDIHHFSVEARARATTARDRTLIGLHRTGFYDG